MNVSSEIKFPLLIDADWLLPEDRAFKPLPKNLALALYDAQCINPKKDEDNTGVHGVVCDEEELLQFLDWYTYGGQIEEVKVEDSEESSAWWGVQLDMAIRGGCEFFTATLFK